MNDDQLIRAGSIATITALLFIAAVLIAVASQ